MLGAHAIRSGITVNTGRHNKGVYKSPRTFLERTRA